MSGAADQDGLLLRVVNDVSGRRADIDHRKRFQSCRVHDRKLIGAYD